MILAALSALAVTLAPPPPADVNAVREVELTQAVKAMNNFQDGVAEKLLKDVLAKHPSAAQAARAHVYLGMISLNELDTEAASARFRQAMLDSVVVELPAQASPKARLLFDQVRQDLMQSPEWSELSRKAHGTGSVPGAIFVEAPPPERHSSHVAGWITGAVALAALGTGLGFGVAQSSAQTALGSGTVTDSNQETSLGNQFHTDGLIADILFGVGGAAAVASVILFLVPSGGGSSDATAALSVTPSGLSVRGAF